MLLNNKLERERLKEGKTIQHNLFNAEEAPKDQSTNAAKEEKERKNATEENAPSK